jgi:hypothetical protein
LKSIFLILPVSEFSRASTAVTDSGLSDIQGFYPPAIGCIRFRSWNTAIFSLGFQLLGQTAMGNAACRTAGRKAGQPAIVCACFVGRFAELRVNGPTSS